MKWLDEKMIKREKIRFVCRILTFFVLLTVTFCRINYVLRDKKECATVAGFGDEKKNSIDVIFLGSSQVVRSIMPMQIWNNLGITSYNLGASATNIPSMYYLAKMAVRTQKPEVIIADMSFIYDGSKIIGTERFHAVFDNFNFAIEKYEALMNLVERKDWLEMVFPIYIYHSGWNEITNENYIQLEDEYYQKGAVIDNGVFSMTMQNKLTNKKNEIPELALEYTYKLIELCNENNIKLVFVNIPLTRYTEEYGFTEYQEYLNTLQDIAEKNDIPYYNGYRDKNYWGLDYYTDFIDMAHTNIRGAAKITSYMEVILSKYNLTDKRNNSRYDEWNEGYQVFSKYYDELCAYKTYELGSIIDFKIDGNADDYFVTGLCAAEATHRWNNGKEADAFFYFREGVEKNLTLCINIAGIYPIDNTAQGLSIYFNDICVGEEYVSNDNLSDIYFEIPAKYVNLTDVNHLSIRFTSVDSSMNYEGNPALSIALDRMKIY